MVTVTPTQLKIARENVEKTREILANFNHLANNHPDGDARDYYATQASKFEEILTQLITDLDDLYEMVGG